MIEFLKTNGWALSVVAIVISVFSLTVTIYDKVKTWREQARIKKLKIDKSILKPILDLKVEEYHTIEVEQKGSTTRTSHKPHYSRLFHLIQGINHTEIENEDICEKLKSIQKLHADNLFTPKNVEQNFSVEFSDELRIFIAETRKYLSDVI